VKIPIVGLGGIEKANDILEYFIVGAAAVQVGTANFSDPAACETLVGNLTRACQRSNIHRISDLIGTFIPDSA